MKKADRQLIVFALLVCVTCSLLLSGVSAALSSRQERQVELDRKRNVLRAFGVDLLDDSGRRIAPETVEHLFARNIGEIVIDPSTGAEIPAENVDPRLVRNKQQLPLFYWTENGARQRYAFPISGQGLWSTIYGFLALEDDLETISGITFYKHGETPGLGGEIERDWYMDQFEGKRLMEGGEVIPLETVKGGMGPRGSTEDPHTIDGISGATITSESVGRLVTEDFKRYNVFFKQLRGS